MKKIVSILYVIVMLAKTLGQKHQVILISSTLIETKALCLLLKEHKYGDSLPLF